MSKSIICQERVCYECGRSDGLELHHIFYGTANRKLSDKDGLVVYLCYNHHRGAEGVHNGNKRLDDKLKRVAQRAYMRTYNKNVAEFRERYGKNYI